MEITKNTRVSEILNDYGDTADIMEMFGGINVGRYSFRKMMSAALAVVMEARIHRIPLDELFQILESATSSSTQSRTPGRQK